MSSARSKDGAERRHTVALVGLVLVHLIWCFIEVLGRLGVEYAGVHSEELANPWMARMLLEGHWGSWTELRYRSFCGGCGVEGTLAAPILALLGARIAAWKLVPLLFHAAVVGTSVALARRWWGDRSALFTAAMWLGAPAIFLEMGAIGWGNHAEVMSLVFGSLLLLGTGDSTKRPIGAGLLAAFAVWFCRTGALLLPAALLVLMVLPKSARLRGMGRFGVAFLAGSALHLNGVGARSHEVEPLSFAGGAGILAAPFELVQWCFSTAMVSSLWRSAWMDGNRAPVVYGLALVLAITAGLLAAWRERARLTVAATAPMLAVGWVAGMAAGYRHWEGIRRGVPSSAFELRYWAPAFAIAVLLVAAAAGRRSRRWVSAGIWVLPAIGVLLRVATMEPPRFDLIDRPLPTQQGRVPTIEQAPLSELAGLVAARRAEPADMRTAYVRAAAERLFQARLDSIVETAAAAGTSRDRAQELRKGVETGEPSGALDALMSLPGVSPDRSLEQFVDSLDGSDLRAAALYLVPRFAGPSASAFPHGPLSEPARAFRDGLSVEGRAAFDDACGAILMGRTWHPTTLAEALVDHPSLSDVAPEFRVGACRQVGVVLGEAATLARSDRTTLDQILAVPPATCAVQAVEEGISGGSWAIGGCRARPDLVQIGGGKSRCRE
jgi:hypothetical protein